MHIVPGAARRHRPRKLGGDRGAGDHDGAGLQLRNDPVIAEQNAFALRGVQDHDDDRIEFARDVAESAALAAFRFETRHCFRIDVDAMDAMSGAQQGRGHAVTH